MYKVLIVDDEPYVLEGLKLMIDWQKYGFSVCAEATNGDDALKIINACNPHLVVTDIRMPGMDGLQLIKEASGIPGNMSKFVILSGYSDFTYAKTAMHYNVCSYILKPLDEEEIINAIDKIGKQIQKEAIKAKMSQKQLLFIANDIMRKVVNGETRQHVLSRAKYILDYDGNKELRLVLVQLGHYNSLHGAYTGTELHAIKKKIMAAIAENRGRMAQLQIFDDDIDTFYIIISESKECLCKSEIRQYVKCLQRTILDTCNYSISAFISDSMSKIESLPVLYRQAVMAMSFKFFHDEGCIIFYKDIKNIRQNYNLDTSSSDMLLQDIINCNFSGISDKINIIFNEFISDLKVPEVVMLYIQNIELEAIRYILSLNKDIDNLSDNIMKFNHNSSYA